jgi:autotransporter-associated beta strand protein
MSVKGQITRRVRVVGSVAAVIAMAAISCPVLAQSGSWNGSAGDTLWSNAGNWNGGTIADGAGNTASFTGVDLVSDQTINLDSARTLGGLNFSDSDPGTSGGWFMTGSQLNLATGSTVNVSNMGFGVAANIANVIAGTEGLTKTGDGQLTLSGTNTFTGGLRVNGGTVRLEIAGALAGQATTLNNGTVNVPASLGTVTVAAGSTGRVVARAFAGFIGSNVANGGIVAAGPGSSLTIEGQFTGANFGNLDGNWVPNQANAYTSVTFVGTNAGGQSNFRPRLNGGGFNNNTFLNSTLNLDNAIITPRTNSGGNTLFIGALSGTATATLAGGNTGREITYQVGALNTSTTYSGGFAVASGLNFTKVGAGTLTLDGNIGTISGTANPNTAGTFRVSAGTVALVGNADLGTAQNIIIEAAGTLNVAGYTANPIYSTGAGNTLAATPIPQTVGGNGTIVGNYQHDEGTLRPGLTANIGATLTFANNLVLGSAGASNMQILQDITPSLTTGNDKLQVNGTLTIADFGAVTVNFLGGASTGDYVVAESVNPIVDAAKLSGWTVNWGARGASPTLSVDGTGTKLLMTVSSGGAFTLDWANDAGGTWDVNSTANYVNSTGVNTPEKFFQLDGVRFRDSFNDGAGGQTNLSGGGKTITLNTTVSPSVVTVDASSVEYTIEGTGRITGSASLNKSGNGTLILGVTNDNTGPTTITGGRLQLWTFPTNGNVGPGQINIDNGATISYRHPGTTTVANVINVGPAGANFEANGAGLTTVGALAGSGNITLTTLEAVKGIDLNGAFADFTGGVTVGPAVFTRFRNNTNLSTAELVVDGGALGFGSTNNAITSRIGALSGNGPVFGYASAAGGQLTTYIIGEKNLPTVTYSGTIQDSNNANTFPLVITKRGTGIQVFAGPALYTGATNVEAGEMHFSGGATGSVALNVSADAKAAYLAGTNSVGIISGLGTVEVKDGATLAVTGLNQVNSVGSLLLNATGVLTLGDNDLVVNYAGESPIAALLAALQNSQIVVNGDAGGLPTYLAIAEAADLGLTDFGGVAVDDTAVVAKFTYVGDANLDGQVDALDYERVDLAIGNSGVFGTAQGDLNYDGNVDALDYEQIDLNIGNGVGSPLAGVFIPEPASLSLVALGAALLGRRSRR